jgi:hypothetical protein
VKTYIKQLLREELLSQDKTDVIKITDFINFTKKYLDIKDDIKVKLAYERTPDLQTTAYYEMGKMIKVYVKNRSSCDFFRSIAHELVHHKQFIENRLTSPSKDGEDGSPIENEANAKAGEIIRQYGKLHPEIYT